MFWKTRNKCKLFMSHFNNPMIQMDPANIVELGVYILFPANISLICIQGCKSYN